MNENKHILVLDSDSAIRDLMLEYLTSLGYQVTTRADLAGALKAANKNPAQVIIAEMHLLNVRDMAPLKDLLRLQPATRVILIAGTLNLNSILKSFRHGAFDLIIKPIQLPHLLESIEKAFAEYDASPVERRLRGRIAELENELENSGNGKADHEPAGEEVTASADCGPWDAPETVDTIDDGGLIHGKAAD